MLERLGVSVFVPSHICSASQYRHPLAVSESLFVTMNSSKANLLHCQLNNINFCSLNLVALFVVSLGRKVPDCIATYDYRLEQEFP
jgi:hypothetical protein